MDEPRDPAVMHIGEVAERTELSVRSLRHWEQVGVLRPSGRTEGGFRLYTETDVERILVVRRMKPLGFSLEEMRDLLADVDLLASGVADHEAAAAARARIDAVRAEAVERRHRLERQLGMADELIDILRTQVDGA